MACRPLACTIVTLAVSLLLTELARSQEPPSDASPAAVGPIPIRFEGYLPGTVNDSLAGEFDIEFRIYRSPQGGEPLWRETRRLEVVDGRIDVQLGSVTPIPLEIHEATFKWIGASVNGSCEVYPRYHVVNVVYVSAQEALRARSREKSASAPVGQNDTVDVATQGPATWLEALRRARALGTDLPDHGQWYGALRTCSVDSLLARSEHYEWVLPWAYDTASHGRANEYFRGRFQGCDYMDLSPQKRYAYRLLTTPKAPAIPRLGPRGAEARARAKTWLIGRQRADGSFVTRRARGIPTEALTAMALWALCAEETPTTEAPLNEARARAVGFLVARQQEDGGIYRPGAGLTHTTSAVVRQALRSWSRCTDDVPDEIVTAAARLDTFLGTGWKEESSTPSERSVAAADLESSLEALEGEGGLSVESKRALAFLRRARRNEAVASHGPRSGGVDYHQLLRLLGQDLRAEDPIVRRAERRLAERYTLERNPDLTLRFGPAAAGDAGYYYYLLTVARVLSAIGDPEFTTLEGETHPWASQLVERLASLQRADGSWVNANGRWWEDEPVLVTAYGLLALERCRGLTLPAER